MLDRRDMVRLAATSMGRAMLVKLALPAAVALMLLLGLLVLFGPSAVEQANGCVPEVGTPQIVDVSNTATGEVRAEQLANAGAIDQVARSRGLPGAAVRVALIAGLTESSLLNLDRGHADSLGIFQMRPSQGWGTAAQLQDVEYQAEAFFGGPGPPAPPGLVDHRDWPRLPPGEAAQAVERSAYPERYAQHLSEAETLATEAGIDLDRPGNPYAGPTSGTPTTQIDNASTTDSTSEVGTVQIVQANVPGRSADFPAAVEKIFSTDPDFVSLNEMMSRPTTEFTPTGYDSWRAPRGDDGTLESMSTAVAWRTDRWSLVAQGRVIIVDQGPRSTDAGRAANWVSLTSTDLGQVSMISVHHMINPAVHGPNLARRQELYLKGMERLRDLITELSASGPVFVAGDFNSQYSSNDPWGPRAVLGQVDLQPTFDTLGATATHHAGGVIDYIFHQPQASTATRQWTAPLPSDHLLLGAEFTTEGGLTNVEVNCTGTLGNTDPVTGTYLPEGCTIVPDPTTGRGCLTPRMNTALEAVQGLSHSSVACWDEHAWNPTSDHPRGQACDVFFGPGGVLPTPAGKTQGNALAQFFTQRADQYGINYLIWYGRMWRASTGEWTPYSGGGIYDPADITGGHYDHVHISVH